MTFYVLLALLNGVISGVTRAINGQLGTASDPFLASWWNHALGFVVMTLALLGVGQWQPGLLASAPLESYLGGLFGALFVAVNSHVFLRLGAIYSVLLVMGGQMISALLIDYEDHGAAPTLVQWLGTALVLLGVYVIRAKVASASGDGALGAASGPRRMVAPTDRAAPPCTAPLTRGQALEWRRSRRALASRSAGDRFG